MSSWYIRTYVRIQMTFRLLLSATPTLHVSVRAVITLPLLPLLVQTPVRGRWTHVGDTTTMSPAASSTLDRSSSSVRTCTWHTHDSLPLHCPHAPQQGTSHSIHPCPHCFTSYLFCFLSTLPIRPFTLMDSTLTFSFALCLSYELCTQTHSKLNATIKGHSFSHVCVHRHVCVL